MSATTPHAEPNTIVTAAVSPQVLRPTFDAASVYKTCTWEIFSTCTSQDMRTLNSKHLQSASIQQIETSPAGHVTHIHLGMSSCCAAEVFAPSTDLPDELLTEGVLAEGESLEEAAGKE